MSLFAALVIIMVPVGVFLAVVFELSWWQVALVLIFIGAVAFSREPT